MRKGLYNRSSEATDATHLVLLEVCTKVRSRKRGTWLLAKLSCPAILRALQPGQRGHPCAKVRQMGEIGQVFHRPGRSPIDFQTGPRPPAGKIALRRLLIG